MITEDQIRAQFLAIPNDPFFPYSVTIMQNHGENASGQPTRTYDSLGEDTERIPARVAPMILQRPSTPEVRGSGFTATDNTLHCILKGYFPQIKDDMFASVWVTANGDGAAVLFRIGSIDGPGNPVYTRLRLEDVRA